MPNLCWNQLNVSGPKEDIARFAKTVAGEEPLDFNKILPMPEDLEGIIHGRTEIDGVKFRNWREVDDKKIGITTEEINQLVKEHGAKDWYDWSIANWGTKWNCYKVVMNQLIDNRLLYSFMTAWAPPTPVVKAMAKMFPTLNFSMHSEELDLLLYTDIEWENGELISNSKGEMEYNEDDKEFVCL